MKTTVISCRVDASLATRVKDEARAVGIGPGVYLQRAVRAYIKESEVEVSRGKESVVDELLAAHQDQMDKLDEISTTLTAVVKLFRDQG